MGRNKVPLWLRQLATDIDEVLEEYDGWSKLREEVKAWSADYYRHVLKLPKRIGDRPLEGRVLDRRIRRRGSEMAALAAVELIPLPNRRLTLREQCALLAAIHDVCGGGQRIDAWETTPKRPEQGRTPSHFFAFFRLQRDVLDGGLSKPDEKRLRRMLKEVESHLARGRKRTSTAASPTEGKTHDQPAIQRLMGVFTSGKSDNRIKQAAEVVEDMKLTTDEKLNRIYGLIGIPATASAPQLGRLLGVSKQAVFKTQWWKENRKGEKANEIGRRRDQLLKKGARYESKPSDDE